MHQRDNYIIHMSSSAIQPTTNTLMEGINGACISALLHNMRFSLGKTAVVEKLIYNNNDTEWSHLSYSWQY